MVGRASGGARTGVGVALGRVAVGSMVANICSYLIHLTASRWWLDTADYGELAVGLSALLVLGVAALAVQAVVARAVVQHADRGAIGRVTWQTTAVVAVLAVLIAPGLAVATSIGVGTALAAFAAAPLLVIVGAGQGVLQGRGAFRLLAWVLAGVGVLRTVPVMVALALGAGPTGALVAGAAGTGCAAILTTVAVRSSGSSRPPVQSSAHPAEPTLLDVAHACGVQLVLIVAASIDLLLSRTVLTADAAGIYALGAIATKVAFWLPQAVGVVVYPRLADPATSRRALTRAIGVVAAIGVTLTILAGIAGPLVPIVVRPDYRPLVGVLWIFAYTGGALAVLQVALLSAIARRDTRIAWLTWIVVGAEVLVILTLAHSVVTLALTAAAAATVAAAATAGWVLWRDRWVRRSAPGSSQAGHPAPRPPIRIDEAESRDHRREAGDGSQRRDDDAPHGDG